MAAETLRADGRLPCRNGNGTLVVDASGLNVGIPIDSVHLDARGAVERLQLQANAGSEFGNLALSGSTTRRNGRWQGTLASLQLEPSRGSAWSLQDPTTFAQPGDGWSLDSTCLAAADGGTLCANGARSEARRVGKGGVSTCKSWGSPLHEQKKTNIT